MKRQHRRLHQQPGLLLTLFGRLVSSVLLLLSAGCGQASDVGNTISERGYDVHFSAAFEAAGQAQIQIEIQQANAELRQLDFNAPRARYRLLSDDGSAEQSDKRIVWQVPASGGALSIEVHINQQRGEAYDALQSPTWVIMRLGDLFPRARARTLKGAVSRSTFSLRGSGQGLEDWSFETPYGNVDDHPTTIPIRRGFNHPTGWMIGGDLGTRRTIIGDHRITISAPKGSGFRRMDVLSFLRWSWPHVTRIYPDLPPRILIVGAPSPMWRGALSAPGSVFLHTERPLISENGTSSLLHELGHVAGLSSADDGDDWIVEGLAEFYSVEILRRSGAVSERRAQRTLQTLSAWAERDGGKLSDPSKGADTAAAVTYFKQLQDQLSASSLDAVLSQLLKQPSINREALDAAVQHVATPSPGNPDD